MAYKKLWHTLCDDTDSSKHCNQGDLKMLCLKKSFATSLLIITSLFFSIAPAFAETATVSWDANTENDLSGYKIYYGTSSGSYDNVLDVGNTTSFVINNLVAGTTYFVVVTAYDFSRNESGFSDEVSLAPAQGTAPQVTGVSVGDNTKLDVLFSKPLDKASAENRPGQRQRHSRRGPLHRRLDTREKSRPVYLRQSHKQRARLPRQNPRRRAAPT